MTKPNDKEKPEKPDSDKEKRFLNAYPVAAWGQAEFKSALDRALDVLSQAKAKLETVSYSTVAAVPSVALPQPPIHYSAVIWFHLPKGGTFPPESEAPAG